MKQIRSKPALFRSLLSTLLAALLLIGCSPRAVVRTPAAAAPGVWKISSAQTAFLDDLQRDTFAYFWKTTNPKNGMTPDRVPDGEDASVAAIGFGLTAYVVGAQHGFVSRAAAAERTRSALRFLWNAPQGPGTKDVAGDHGFFYHFLDMTSGNRSRDSELSTIDTALLMAGVLSSESFFDGSNATEDEIRTLADQLYRRVDWTWMYSSRHRPLLSMGWSPERGFIETDWGGYNEGMLLYILALGSPTHPVDPRAWDRWTASYQWDSTSKDNQHIEFGPLFGHQYSHVWIDFRGIQDSFMRDKGIDYFVNSARATYANRDYCIQNPGHWAGYSGNLWGLTACDGPTESEATPSAAPPAFHSYWARAAGSGDARDDGTIAPTAAGGSVPFAPEVAIPTLKLMHDRFGQRLYGEFGFRDAFNLSYPGKGTAPAGWFDRHYLAIDEGPILLMVENYRTELVWKLMKRSSYIREGLAKAGFQGGWLARRAERSALARAAVTVSALSTP